MVLGEEESCCSSALIRKEQQYINDVPKLEALYNIDSLKARCKKGKRLNVKILEKQSPTMTHVTWEATATEMS